MTGNKAQPRRDGGAGEPRCAPSRHRAELARPTPARSPSRSAHSAGFGRRRAAVLATACAVLLGVGAAGQAAESGSPASGNPAASGRAADPLSRLDVERVRADSHAAPGPAAPPAPAGSATTAPAPPAAAAPGAAPPAPAAPVPAAPAPAAPAPPPAPVAEAPKPVAVDDPAGAQAYAAAQLASHGWAASQMQCLTKLWTKESDWKTTATNPSSGAYGVVQSLPAEKMASAGADYRTNYRTQIKWGLTYIKQRYGSPCGALNFHYANNWY